MKALKVILIALVVILVVIVGAGATLVGFNHTGHQSGDQMVMGDNKQTNNDDKTSTNNQSSSNQDQQAITNDNQTNTNNQTQEGKDKANSTESKDSVNQTVQGKDSKVPVVVAAEQVPPDEYLKQMQQAMDLIKQGTGLMANAPYVSSAKGTPGDLKSQGNTSSTTDNSGDMSKMHEGIYKLAQGNTLMDQAIQNMGQEVKKARDNNISYYQVQPSNPQYFNNNPYLNVPYGSQFGMYPNQNNQNQNSQTQNNQTQNSHQGMQNQQSTNTNDNMNMNMASHSTLSGIINVQTVTYIIYGFLFLSIIGVFFAIFGFINSLFKPTLTEEQRGDSFAG